MDQSELLSSNSSLVLNHLHSKSKKFILDNPSEEDPYRPLHQAFQLFLQTLNNECQQLHQRIEFLRKYRKSTVPSSEKLHEISTQTTELLYSLINQKKSLRLRIIIPIDFINNLTNIYDPWRKCY